MRSASRSCTGTIHTSLLAHPAVIRATVNLLSNSATVVYDSNVMVTDEVKEVIEDTGYGAEVVESKPVQDGGELRRIGEEKVAVGEKEKEVDRELVSIFAVGGMTCS